MSAQEGQDTDEYIKGPYGIKLHKIFTGSHSGITYDSDGDPVIRMVHYNSPPGMSGGGGSRKRGEAVNDELAVDESHSNKNLPSTLDYKNREVITVGDKDYILYDNKWLELLPNAKYEFWIEDTFHPEGGMTITRSREEIAITNYEIRQGSIGGALGTGIGSLPFWLEVFTGVFRFSPIGVIGGYGGGTIISLRQMEKRMAEHDRHVEHNRNKK